MSSRYNPGMSAQDLQKEAQVMQFEAQFTGLIFKLHDQCWKKCSVAGNSTGLGYREKDCIKNCVPRYFDAQKVVTDGIKSALEETQR